MFSGLGAIGLLIGASMMQPTIHRDEQGHLTSTNSPLRLILTNAFFFMKGMMIGMPIGALFVDFRAQNQPLLPFAPFFGASASLVPHLFQ